MTKRTRYFMFGSALVLVVGLSTGLVALYGGDLSLGSPAAPGSADLTYVPSDASAVAFANVHDIMNSEFRQKIKQVLPTGEEKDKMFAETGIDIEKDLDTIVGGFSGTGMPSASGAIVLLRGRFNQAKLEAVGTQHGAVFEDYKGKRLMVSPAEGKMLGGERACVGFVDKGLVAMGELSAVKRAIDAHATSDNVTKNADIMKFVADVAGTSNAWAIGKSDQATKAAGLPQMVSDQLAAVQWIGLSAKVNGGVSGILRAEARDDKAAEDLRAVINGGLAAAHLVAGKEPKLDGLLNSLQLSGSGKSVALAFTLPPEVLDLINGVAGLKNLGIKK
jgi:hypothetical protein